MPATLAVRAPWGFSNCASASEPILLASHTSQNPEGLGAKPPGSHLEAGIPRKLHLRFETAQGLVDE